MADNATHFDDAASYDLFMGRWSRAVGATFLDWLKAPQGARWLEVGCGSGAFTAMVLDLCAPSAINALDPSRSQVEYASRLPLSQPVEFHVADAQSMPFADASFDVVASALVINFVPDRPRALREMRRVARAGGMVAGYVWDFIAERGPTRPMRVGLSRIGTEPPRPLMGAEDTSLEALAALFRNAGLERIETTAIDVSLDFPSFDEYWRVQSPPLHPNVKAVKALAPDERARLMEFVRAELTIHPDGRIGGSARAHAIKARVPG